MIIIHYHDLNSVDIKTVNNSESKKLYFSCNLREVFYPSIMMIKFIDITINVQ